MFSIASPAQLLQQHQAASRPANPGFQEPRLPTDVEAFWTDLETHGWAAEHDVAAVDPTGYTFLSFVMFHCPHLMPDAVGLFQQHPQAADLINRPDPHGHHQGWAPLHWAARLFQGQPWVPTLIALGADATATCSDANTPPEDWPQALGLLMLCFNPRMQQFYQPNLDASVAAAQALIEAGSDVKHVNDEGSLPLHAAAQHAPHLVPLLLAHPGAPATINAIDHYAQTPLVRALIGQPPLVEDLLQAGADPWLDLPRKDRAFCNAVDVAQKLMAWEIQTTYPDRNEAMSAWKVFLDKAEQAPQQG